MSDYLANLVAKNISQDRGFRFLTGELRPYLASRFEPPTADNPGRSDSSLKEISQQEFVSTEPPSFSHTPPIGHPDNQRYQNNIQPSIDATGISSMASEKDQLSANIEELMPQLIERMSAESAQPSQEIYPIRGGTELSADISLSSNNSNQINNVVMATKKSMLKAQTNSQSRFTNVPGKASESPEQTADFRTKATFQDISADFSELQPSEDTPMEVSTPSNQPLELYPINQQDEEVQPPDRRPFPLYSPQRLFVSDFETDAEKTPTKSKASSQKAIRQKNNQTLQSALSRLSKQEFEAVAVPTPTVNVTIGRVEVRAIAAPLAAESKTRTTPVMTLEEYLQQRTTGGG